MVAELNGLKIEYAQNGDRITIRKVEADKSQIIIPQMIDGKTVTAIDKKAFFGSYAVSIFLPQSIDSIGNWAFADMKQLREITITGNIKNVGRDIFWKSTEIKRINLSNEACDWYGLLPIMINDLKDSKAMSYGEDRYQRFDASCKEYIIQDDKVGFSPILAGGEEDYLTNENDLSYHMKKERMNKVRIIFERLRFDTDLSDDMKAFYIDYLKSHCILSDGGLNETWEYVKNVSEDRNIYYDIFSKYGIFNYVYIDKAIEDTEGKNLELRMYLLRKNNSSDNSSPSASSLNIVNNSFFDMLKI